MNYLFSLIIVHLIGTSLCGQCPTDPEVIAPCKCLESNISCGGDKMIDLKKMFRQLSNDKTGQRKDFKTFFLNNTVISTLEEHTFYDITFDNIQISDATNLSVIHIRAFEGTNSETKRFVAENTKITVQYPDNDIFSALSSMNHLEFLTIQNSKLIEIPNNAFKPLIGNQLQLTTIRLNSNNIIKIGEYAFNELPNLTNLILSENKIDFISETALMMDKPYNNLLLIDLSNNKLDDDSFHKEPFINLNKPVILDLTGNSGLKHLKINEFKPFLDYSEKNRIKTDSLNCTDCTSSWLVQPKYASRLDTIKCSNGNLLKNFTNFPGCPSICITCE